MSRGGPHSAADVLAAIGMPIPYHCRCGQPTGRPGDSCKGCHEAERLERQAEDIQCRVKDRVPATYRWAKLSESGELPAAMKNPTLLTDVWLWLKTEDAPPVLLLRGETHSLKSTIAAACIRHETLAGRDAFFVLAVDCVPPPDKAPKERLELHQTAMSRLRRRVLVVVDDLAKVLGGAPGDTPIAAYRRGELCDELRRRCQARIKTIVTLDLEDRATKGRPAPGIVECLGEDMLGRLTDERNAVVIRLERKARQQ